jgi:hypothetical protein
MNWNPLRKGDVSTVDTFLDGVTSGLTYNWGDKPEIISAGPEAGALTVRFEGRGSNNDQFAFRLWAYPENGPAEYICEGSCTLGTAIIDSDTSTRHVDTINISDYENWYNIPAVIDGSGSNRIAKIATDRCGYKYVYCEISGVGNGAGYADAANPLERTF